jgi:acyl-CoA thioester hydrolase
MEGFRHQTAIQVRFKDIDAMGHVNNANHFTYFELARVNYFDEVVKLPIAWSRQGIILAKMSINYKSPIFLKDKVTVWCKVSRIGNTSFDCDYKITCERDGKVVVAAEGTSTQVCFDYEKNSPYPVPESWRKCTEEFESGH